MLYYTIYQSTSYTRVVVSKPRPFVLRKKLRRFGDIHPCSLLRRFLCHIESDLRKPVQRENGRGHGQRTT